MTAAAVRTIPDREPRFSLRFERGRGILALARPFAFGVGAIESLELDLGRLPSPIDLRAGAARFRHRRAALVAAVLRIDLDALAQTLSEPGLELRVLGASAAGPPGVGGEGVAIALRDPLRTIAFDLLPAWDGADLVLAPRGARAAIEGPRAPIADVLRALASVGAPLVAERGVVRVERPIERMLAEALVPVGWRVPDARGVSRAAPVLQDRCLRIALGRDAESGPSGGPVARAALEDARVLGPVLDALAADLVGDAEAIVLGAQTRLGPPSEELEALAAELMSASASSGARALPSLRPGPRSSALALRDALARRDVDRAARHARELDAIEPDGDLAIEGLRAASVLAASGAAAEEDPGTAADLAARALARRPRDPELALEWLERVSRAIEGERVITGVRAIRATITGSRRAEVLRACAAVLDRAGEPAEARGCWDEAARLAPDDPDAHEGLARALAGTPRALDAWDRVAALRADDPDARARALIHAARAASPGPGAATRLEKAVEVAADDRVRIDALALLAQTRRAIGARDAAAEADARILELSERMTGETIVLALRAAATAAIDERAEPRARALLAAMARSGAREDDVHALSDAIDRWDLDALDRDAPERADDDRGDPADRALRARAIAERLRATGRFGDAARALARAGAILRDAATLRAAVELAEKGADWPAALEVIDRAIEVVGTGAAKSALEARRDAIRARM